MSGAEKIHRVERLLNLLALLLRSREPLSAREIRETVTGYREREESESTFTRRFYRDREELRRHGVEIHHEPATREDEGGFLIRREEYYLPRLRLEPMESLLLGQLAASLEGGGEAGRFARALRSAIRKLHFDHPGPEEDPVDGLAEAVKPALRLPGEERDLSLVLAAAVGERRVVQFGYHSLGRDRRERRTVDPYGLRFVGGHWYLVGRDHRSRDLRTFRLTRVEEPVEVRDPVGAFEVPREFRLEDHVPGGPWGFGGPGPAAVTVTFDEQVWWLVLEDVAGERRVAPAGERTLRFGGGNLPALLRYLARYLDHVEIAGPPEARRAFQDLARAARERHREATG